MTRIFLPPDRLKTDHIIVSGDQSRYLSVVLRVKQGDELTIFDGQGYKYKCRVLSSHKKEVSAELITREPYSVESPLSLALAQGLPKGNKMDLIIQKSTELGISRVIPLITERSQVRQTNKIERWRKIARSASQQSGRDKVPAIEAPLSFSEFIKETVRKAETHKGIVFFEKETNDKNLKELLCIFKDIKQITLLIGPEGGFSNEEIIDAVKAGFIRASLGPRILRTETAPIAAVSIIQYELGYAD